MKRTLYLITAIILFGTSCRNTDFKKEKDGSEYRVIVNENGKKAVKGNFLQLNRLVKYKDSVLFSSIENSSPMFVPFDTAQLPPFFKEIREGDSLILRESTDTLLKKGMGMSAPFMKKHEYIYNYFKVVKVFTSADEAQKAAKTFEAGAKEKAYTKTIETVNKLLTDNAAQVKTDDQIISDYIKKNNITATKTPWGTYVAIETPGTGENLNPSAIAEINYTGKTLKDTVFDSNTDKQFGHVKPIDIDMSEFNVIPGWIDGLKLMKKGSKGKLIIPSTLGYGKNGSGPKIGPNENLVFDIDVADVISREQFEAKQMEERNEMMRQRQEMQQQMQQRNPSGPQPPQPGQ